MAPSPVLSLRDVVFGYGATAVLHGVTLSVRAGEGAALLGRNGAGKTTLTRLAMALERPWSGAVECVGRSTAGRGPEDLADRVGYLFQHPESQLVERTVAGEVGLGPRLLGWPEERIAEAVPAVLAEVGMSDMSTEHPLDLSLPLRRMVALAAALVAEPALLLLDEPTAGLDRERRRRVEGIVRGRRERGTAVVAVTHDPAFAVECLDRGIVLRAGRVSDDGPIGELLTRGEAAVAPPPLARLDRELELGSRSWRLADVAAALAARCRAQGPGIS